MVGLSKYLNSPFGQAFIITLLCLVFFLAGPSPVFETNDDAFMLLAVSGKGFSLAPDAHLVWVNYAFASALRGLYLAIPGVPWYGLFHVVAVFFCIFCLNLSVAIQRRRPHFALRLLLSLALVLPFAIMIQFTKTAFLLALTGFFSLYSVGNGGESRRAYRNAAYLVVLFLLILAFLVRKESFFMASLFCVPLCISVLRNRLKPTVLVLGCAILLMCAASFYHNLNYCGDWGAFTRLQKKVARFTDYRDFDFRQNIQVFDQVGWSRNDLKTIQTWGHVDPDVFSEDKVGFVLSRVGGVGQNDPVELLGTALSPGYVWTYVVVSSLICIFFVLLSSREGVGRCLVFAPFPFFVVLSFLLFNGRLTPWLVVPASCFLPWSLAFFCPGSVGKLKSYRWFSVLFVCFVFLGCFQQIVELNSACETREFRNRAIKKLIDQTKSKPITVVSWANSFPYEGIFPLESTSYLDGIRLVSLSSLNQSPYQKANLKSLGIGNVFEDLLAPGYLFVALKETHEPIFVNYMREHYGVNVRLKVVFRDSGLVLYKPMR